MSNDKKGKLILENRAQLTIEGVKHVLGFDDGYLSLDTDLGIVTVGGDGMMIDSLEGDGGIIIISGKISSIDYSEPKSECGFLKRLFK